MLSKTSPVKVNVKQSSKPIQGIIYRFTFAPYIILYHWDKSFTVLKRVELQNGTIGYFQQAYMIPYDIEDSHTTYGGEVPPSYPPKG